MMELKALYFPWLLVDIKLCVFLVVLLSVNPSVSRSLPPDEPINIAIMLPRYPLPSTRGSKPWLVAGRHYPYHLQMVVPAMRIALEKVKNTTLVVPNNISLIVDDTECWLNTAQFAAIDMMYIHKVMAFFGPVCEYALAPVGRFSTRWNLPLITAGGQASGYDDFDQYKLITNLRPPHRKLAHFVAALWKIYEWKRGVIVFHDGDAHIKDEVFMAGGVYDMLEKASGGGYGLNLTFQPFNEFDYSDERYVELLERDVTPYTRGEYSNRYVLSDRLISIKPS